ncbi:alpha-glucosidase [Nitzschia inconspicua]|uniref:Alpha-glucosidase n=1 Tax=Nitzschia inconspicua TaxID=303405 RepID=A0A9K3L956_9STRA|nr:alpha-glucosidase [Nitzschia inconspicua]
MLHRWVLAATAACCVLINTEGIMAVDQSKFRTCQQTAFCQHHRNGNSQNLYQYKIIEKSVQFHMPGETTKEHTHDAGADQPKNDEEEKAGLWKSLQDRILGSGSSDDSQGKRRVKDPYVRGPPPTLTGTLVNTATETSTGKKEYLDFTVHALADGMVRLRITEVHHVDGSAGTPHDEARVTYDELVLTPETIHAAQHARWIRPGDSYLVDLLGSTTAANDYMGLQYGDASGQHGMFLMLRIDSFAAYVYRESDLKKGPIITMGNRGMTHFEIRRLKDSNGDNAIGDDMVLDEQDPENAEKPEKEIVGYWEDGLAIYADGTREERKVEEADHRQLSEAELKREGMWEEKFGQHVDHKRNGPTSVGSDISFPQSSFLYGLPEHASSTALKRTAGEGAEYEHPYRLYNLDVFEYDLDVPMALYGAVPLLVSQSKATGTSGVFWFNPTETFVDIDEDNESKTSHWISESGVIDVFFIPGPSPQEFYRQYSKLTGTMPLPPMFSLGYHQCRWNYKDEQDVYQVHNKFEELDYPYDVLWLDIEHANEKRYFTWDKNLFPNPKQMQEKLWSQGRRMVTIVDPHVKRDDGYYIHKEATAKGLYIKERDGVKDYDGWCWPGSSSYLDFTNEKARSWWAEQFAYNRYQGSTPSLFTWNDMNEPSVFNGPEVSMQKHLLNLNGEEHREWHNLYGMLFQRSTMEGLIRRNKGENVRPFVLSRAFFAGSQRYGSIWTGDNAAEWSHLAISSPMLLSLNIGALSFVGADVGGFFGNTDAELMTRWMQAGAYQPFFRGHAHHDAKRREPWMFGEETMVRLRKAAMARYALLPFWYTIFQEAGETGMPVMRTMWMQYPEIEALYATDDQFLIGSDLLVKPVTAPGVYETTVQFPSDDAWYDAESLALVSKQGTKGGVHDVTVPSDLDTIPVFQRGGSVIPRKLRLRRSTHTMTRDPYTLFVALDESGHACGTLYMDDETTFSHVKKSEFATAEFSVDLTSPTGYIRNVVNVGSGWKNMAEETHRMIERIIVMGVTKHPSSVDEVGESLGFSHDSNTQILVIRKPQLSAMVDWEIKISF